MDLKLKGKVAIITGASGGIGSGCARVFAEEGVNVALNYFSRPDRAEALAKELMDTYGVRAIAVQADVGKQEDIQRMFRETVEAFGTVDILINNAGAVGDQFRAHVPIENFDLDNFRRREAIIVESLFTSAHEFVAILREQKKGGHIINVLSKSAYWSGTAGNTMYATTKGAAGVFTQALAHELAYENIYVNAIIPGYVTNPRTEPDTEHYRANLNRTPMRRYATPEEMGYVCAFLCSERAATINGVRVDCTGGAMNGDVEPMPRS